ncbi:MAG: 2-dehydropantoate 2-reductase [Acidimicrobiia bacterium]|nr:2-dehydropantoate 2-reductase [Acidimicrobiia bacterium]
MSSQSIGDDLTAAVIGPGAIGLVAISALHDAGRRPTVAARASFDRVVHRFGGRELVHEVDVLTDPRQANGPADVVFLATKVHQSDGAAAWIEALCGPDSVLAALQNGIDQRERLSRYVAPEAIAPVVVNLPAEREEPGVVTSGGRPSLVVPADEAGARVARALAGSFLPVRQVDDFVTHSWTKLLINSSLGIIGVLGGAPNGVIAEPDAGDLVRALIDEAAAVGRAEGADLPDDIAETIVKRIVTGAPDHRSSIALDRAAGLPTEWEARNKVVVDLADRHGIDVPLNRAGTTLIRLGEPT